jgi:hypothetical protein
MMFVRRPLVIIAVLLTGLTAVRGQTPPFQSPEEAIACHMFGIGHGADGRLDGAGRWRRVSVSPARSRASGIELHVQRQDACRFTVTKQSADGPFRATIDLSKISAWRASGNDGVVSGTGLCISTYHNACPARSFAFEVPDIDDARHAAAFAYLREACPSS